MIKIRNYLQLLRVSHWIKNVLVFIPFFFAVGLFNGPLVINVVLGFICFSLLSSIVYILNDIRDMEKDRLHSAKCRRPLASGEIPVPHAVIVMAVLFAALIALLVMSRVIGSYLYNLKSIGLLLLYMLINIAYSWGLKNIPIVDVTILASGYVIRVLFGALIIGVDISIWLYLVITFGAFYLGLGKRRNEIIGNEKGTRAVMKFYSHNFFDKNMYVCQTLCVVFYALWSIDSVTIERFHTSAFVYTIPVVFIILLKYSLNIETDTDGDPTSVLLSDKVLLLLCVTYIICAFCIIYLNRAAP
ncbi:MAG: UbiA prenyltransferase family protein [Treponema sp.]|jgi:4-hydroxybenzoate polyprenyltransferase|nr:UbiA prenyltransferase family protein [Treponema sp.]